MQENDFTTIAAFPQTPLELVYMMPNAQFPLTPEHLKKTNKKRTDPRIALHNGRIVGYGNYYSYIPNTYCFIGNVIVDPARRSEGVGRWLVTMLMERALALHRMPEVRIACFENNAHAMELYRSMGFQPFSTTMRTGLEGDQWPLIRLRRVA
ncbi:MAG: GNAT family N-acetyltransferase [Magnetococcales bacterium]|nr:GNAT family N-acetyltransferase [Magnetococcales bacterium]